MKQQWPDGWFSERETENGAMLPLNDWEGNFLLVGGGTGASVHLRENFEAHSTSVNLRLTGSFTPLSLSVSARKPLSGRPCQ